jgi:hypothetical protein
MPKIGTIVGMVLAAVLLFMLVRWLRDRLTRRPGTFDDTAPGADPAPGGSFRWDAGNSVDSEGGGGD